MKDILGLIDKKIKEIEDKKEQMRTKDKTINAWFDIQVLPLKELREEILSDVKPQEEPTLRNQIIDILRAEKEPISKANILDRVKFGVYSPEEFFDEEIQRLLEDGFIFEPKANYLRWLG